MAPAEKQQLDKVFAILALQRNEIKELKEYWTTDKDEFSQRFDNIHKEVSSKLKARVQSVRRDERTRGSFSGGDGPFGHLTIAFLHQNYLYLGLLADGVGEKAYTAEQGIAIIETVSSMVNTVKKQDGPVAAREAGSGKRSNCWTRFYPCYRYSRTKSAT